MDKEVRRYIIKKQESYRQQLDEENNKVIKGVILGGITAISGVYLLASGNPAVASEFCKSIGLFSLGACGLNVYSIIDGMVKTFSLSNQLEELQGDLDNTNEQGKSL